MADVRLKFRFECLNCFTYIFLGNVDQAAKAIPTDITKRAESEYHFFLHVVSIVAFLQGDIETALRETMNLIKRFDRGKDTINVSFERHVAVAFRSFYQMSLEESKSKKLRFRRSITDALEELFGEAPHYRDYLPVLWLTRRLN